MTTMTIDPPSAQREQTTSLEAGFSDLSAESFIAQKERALGRLENLAGSELMQSAFASIKDGLEYLYSNKKVIAAGAVAGAAVLAGAYYWDLPNTLALGFGGEDSILGGISEPVAGAAAAAGPSVTEVVISADPSMSATPISIAGEQYSLEAFAEKLEALVPNPESGDSLRIVPGAESRPSFEGQLAELLKEREIPFTTEGPFSNTAAIDSVFDPYKVLEP